MEVERTEISPNYSAGFPSGSLHAPGTSGGPNARGREEERCVLVVDDESDARDAIVELIEAEGYAAVGAEHGAAALDLLRGGLKPAIILVDLRMPVMDGWAFCEAVRAEERWAEIPIAIVTASASIERLPERRRDAGLLVKPLNVARLLGILRQHCG